MNSDEMHAQLADLESELRSAVPGPEADVLVLSAGCLRRAAEITRLIDRGASEPQLHIRLVLDEVAQLFGFIALLMARAKPRSPGT